MNGKEFLDSKWVKDGARPETAQKIKVDFDRWTTRVGNLGLLARARQLYEFFLSSDVSGVKKAVVAGALLYAISPLDLIPDFIPVVGWLDDLGVASFALSYIFSQMDKVQARTMNGGREIAASSPEGLLEEDIVGTSAECEWQFNGCQTEVESARYQSAEVKNRLTELKEITEAMSVDGADGFLGRIESKLAANRIMSVAVVGRYSTGKSTLINALLGKSILPSSPIPTTKAITYVMKGSSTSLYSENGEGEITVHDSLNDLLSQYDRDLSSAKKITVTLPDFPFDNLSFTDTPGLEDPDESVAQLTLNAIPDADAVVVLLDANYLQSKVEFQFISSLLKNDKDRKLFVVVNKVDGKDDAQVCALEKTCRSLLIEYGAPNAGVYFLSAKEAEGNAGFLKFKRSLFDFLMNGIQAEVYNHLNNELSSYAALLQESCQARLELVAKDERGRELEVAENQKHAESIASEYEKQKRILTGKFKQYQAQFRLDFSNFSDSLKSSAQQEINASTLEKLRNTEELAKKIKQEIVAFVDANIALINEKLGADISDSQAKIKTELASLQVKIDGANVKDYSAYAGLFMPTAVLLSFLSCGFLTFVWTVIAASLGRNFFESAIEKFLSSVGIKGTKEKLIEEVSENIDKIRKELLARLGKEFVSIEDELAHSFDGAAKNAVASLASVGGKDVVPQKVITDCRDRLQTLVK